MSGSFDLAGLPEQSLTAPRLTRIVITCLKQTLPTFVPSDARLRRWAQPGPTRAGWEEKAAALDEVTDVDTDSIGELVQALRENSRRLLELEEVARVGSWQWDVHA